MIQTVDLSRSGSSPPYARISSDRNQQSAFYDSLIDIEPQQACCDTPFCRQGLDDQAMESKVILPAMPPRVKERYEHSGHRIKRGDVGPFPGVTPNTRVGQIRLVRGSTVLQAHDVIDLMAGKRIVFAQQAILATKTRTIRN